MEYDVTVKTRTNLCRNIGVHTKSLTGVSIRKNVSCGSFYNTEAEKSTSFVPVVWKSYCHCQFSFWMRTAHQEKIKSINECMRTSNLSNWLYVRTDHEILSCLLLCCIFEGSKKLRIYRLLPVPWPKIYVEQVVGSEQKFYFLCCNSNQDNFHKTSPTCRTTTKHPFRKV